MPLNESINGIVAQGLQELTTAEISFGLKLLVIFGIIYLFQTVMRSGFSIIRILIYTVGLFKWIIYKIMKKDI